MTVNIIDPHLHLFNRSLGDYHWLKTQNPPFWSDKAIIQHNFTIEDLNKSLQASTKIKLAGFVHIEAGFDNARPWRELEYLDNLNIDNLNIDNLNIDNLAIESSSRQKSRTIASINLLAAPEHFQATLQKLQQYPSLIGARHIFDEQAYAILASQNAQQNFASLNAVTDFIFELQLPLADESAINVMPLLMQTVANHNQLRFIINHAGFPPKIATRKKSTKISSDPWHLWKKHIAELAKYPNVFIKCSGWEMQDRQYQMSWFSDVTRFCINKFSIERVMLASNFPLCLLGKRIGKEVANKLDKKSGEELMNKSYASYWLDIIESSVIKQCSENEKSALLYNNALHIYKI